MKWLTSVVLAGLLIGGCAGMSEARVVQIDPGHGPMGHVSYTQPLVEHHVDKGWKTTRLYVEMQNGSTFVVTPCRTEDSADCYWQADVRGNGKGRSFIRVNNHTHYIR